MKYSRQGSNVYFRNYQGEALYIINTKCCISSAWKGCISSSRRKYTLTRDEIQGRLCRPWWYTRLTAWWYTKPAAWIKKPRSEERGFLVGKSGFDDGLCPRRFATIMFALRARVVRIHFIFITLYKKRSSLFQVNFFGGEEWIRTTEVVDNRFTVCPLWPLGNFPIFN